MVTVTAGYDDYKYEHRLKEKHDRTCSTRYQVQVLQYHLSEFKFVRSWYSKLEGLTGSHEH